MSQRRILMENNEELLETIYKFIIKKNIISDLKKINLKHELIDKLNKKDFTNIFSQKEIENFLNYKYSDNDKISGESWKNAYNHLINIQLKLKIYRNSKIMIKNMLTIKDKDIDFYNYVKSMFNIVMNYSKKKMLKNNVNIEYNKPVIRLYKTTEKMSGYLKEYLNIMIKKNLSNEEIENAKYAKNKVLEYINHILKNSYNNN